MPAPKVTTESTQRRTRIHENDSDPLIDSPSTSSDDGWNKLSFLHGATVAGASGDMGAAGRSFPERWSSNAGEWQYNEECIDNLRRHTLEQGSSTFSWPQKP